MFLPMMMAIGCPVLVDLNDVGQLGQQQGLRFLLLSLFVPLASRQLSKREGGTPPRLIESVLGMCASR